MAKAGSIEALLREKHAEQLPSRLSPASVKLTWSAAWLGRSDRARRNESTFDWIQFKRDREILSEFGRSGVPAIVADAFRPNARRRCFSKTYLQAPSAVKLTS